MFRKQNELYNVNLYMNEIKIIIIIIKIQPGAFSGETPVRIKQKAYNILNFKMALLFQE
jgi:hypothetical protein